MWLTGNTGRMVREEDVRVNLTVNLTDTEHVDLDGLITERENSQTGNPKYKVTNQLLACLNTQHSPSVSWQLTPGNHKREENS